MAVVPSVPVSESRDSANPLQTKEADMQSITFTKTQPPGWLLAFW
jgi:hypothetical protein